MKRIGVVLSGCGVNEGSEIHEAVLTLLAIDRAGAGALCFAPDKPQLQVINHLSGEPCDERRNVLVEAARIARGHIQPLSAASADELDALIVPGGFGVAKTSAIWRKRALIVKLMPNWRAWCRRCTKCAIH
ncbi:hypothetical protein SODG_005715 [Sodalis praecaptivus]